MTCEGGMNVVASGLNHRRYAGVFFPTNLGMQRLSLAPLGALSAACERASLPKRGSSQTSDRIQIGRTRHKTRRSETTCLGI